MAAALEYKPAGVLLHHVTSDHPHLVLAVIGLPYGIASGFAALVDRLEHDSAWFLRLGQRLGFLRNPTAWDRAGLSFDRGGPGEVRVRLTDGSMIRGAWGAG